MWPFSRPLNFDSTNDYDLFRELWDSINTDNQDVSELFSSKQSLEQYITLHDELKEEDTSIEQIAVLERNYFREDVFVGLEHIKPSRASQARKRFANHMELSIMGGSPY